MNVIPAGLEKAINDINYKTDLLMDKAISLQKEIKKMAVDLTALQAAVAASVAEQNAAIALLQGIPAQITNAVNAAEATAAEGVAGIVSQITTETAELTTAVQAAPQPAA